MKLFLKNMQSSVFVHIYSFKINFNPIFFLHRSDQMREEKPLNLIYAHIIYIYYITHVV